MSSVVREGTGDAGPSLALRGTLRWALLLAASYAFYAALCGSEWLQPVLLLTAAIVVTYICALRLTPGREGRGRLLVLGIAFNLGTLLVFKYTHFFLGALEDGFRQLGTDIDLPSVKLILPVGLSFYTLSAISYLIDVYRGAMPAERHLGRFAVYLAFFPKILAGPIDRALTFLPQLRSRYRFEEQEVVAGLQLILWGLFKKFVIADRLAAFVDATYESTAYAPTASLAIAFYFYAFQIYCDFSGYTDMARGAGKLVGIDLMENFRRAYLSRSPSEFWSRRWHLSLCTWFRDYLYIPMGGSRVSWPRHYFNLAAVFAVSGLWHGASWTFIVWGLLNGLYVCLGTATAPMWRALGGRFPAVSSSTPWNIVRALFTFHLIAFAWIFFRLSSMQDAWTALRRVGAGANQLPAAFLNYGWTSEILISFGLIAFLLVFELFEERRSVWERLASRSVAVRWGFYYLLLMGLAVLGKWQFNQFIYMQF